jgi:hypothetical protein
LAAVLGLRRFLWDSFSGRVSWPRTSYKLLQPNFEVKAVIGMRMTFFFSSELAVSMTDVPDLCSQEPKQKPSPCIAYPRQKEYLCIKKKNPQVYFQYFSFL